MILEFPEIGKIEFEPKDIPTLDDGYWYADTVDKCKKYNFLIKEVNGHTLYLCDSENGAAIEQYLTTFIIHLDCIEDIKWSYTGDAIEFYSWIIDECGDSECDSLDYFPVLVEYVKMTFFLKLLLGAYKNVNHFLYGNEIENNKSTKRITDNATFIKDWSIRIWNV